MFLREEQEANNCSKIILIRTSILGEQILISMVFHIVYPTLGTE